MLRKYIIGLALLYAPQTFAADCPLIPGQTYVMTDTSATLKFYDDIRFIAQGGGVPVLQLDAKGLSDNGKVICEWEDYSKPDKAKVFKSGCPKESPVLAAYYEGNGPATLFIKADENSHSLLVTTYHGKKLYLDLGSLPYSDTYTCGKTSHAKTH